MREVDKSRGEEKVNEKQTEDIYKSKDRDETTRTKSDNVGNRTVEPEPKKQKNQK